MAFQDLRELETALEQKITALRQVNECRDWRFIAGDPPGAEQPDFDDSSWTPIRLSHTWSSAASSVWFRRTLTPSAASEEIDLAGTALEMVIFLAIGATIYIDGRKAYYDRWWADTRAIPLAIAEKAQPGVPMTLAVHCEQGDGFGCFLESRLRYARLEETIGDMELFRQQMAFTRHLLDRLPQPDARLKLAWEAALGTVRQSDLNHNRWETWAERVAKARAALKPFAALAKQYTTYLIGHSHIDMNWLWTLDETIDVCRRDFAAADQLMERYPEFVFSQSQAATYAFMEERQPELFARIQKRVQGGQWDVTANTWVEGDLNTASGEALARHLLHTQRYVQSRFGRRSLICWEPDTFGHPASMPQILAKAGIKYYYACRPGKKQPLFWWEGVDGSRVLALMDPRGYNGEVTPRAVVEPASDLDRYGTQAGIYVYGVGDHGGGATARDIETALKLDAAPYVPHARLSDTASFYQRVEKEAGPLLPVVRDEMNAVFEGCYTTHSDIKWLNRRGESDLLSTEAVATVSALRAGYAYPQAELGETWRLQLFHQFHDILCGAGIGATYREARQRLAPVAEMTGKTTGAALAALAAALDTGRGNEPRVVVFNPLAWERTDVARVPLQGLPVGFVPTAVADSQGRQAPAQVVGDDLVFVAAGVPALGSEVYRLLAQTTIPFADAVSASDDLVLENELLRLHVHEASGAIDELYDKENRRDLAGKPTGWGPERNQRSADLNLMQVVYEQPHSMSAWNIGETTRVDHLISGATAKVVARGPVCAIVETERQVLSSTVKQRIVLYRGLRRIDVETEIDWHEQGTAVEDAPMLRVEFTPLVAANARATYEIPFAALERPAKGAEVPALRWADMSDDGYGLTLLNNGKYGHHAHYHTLGLTLVRSSYEPDGQPDQGPQHFTYSLYPHTGDWRQACSTQRSAELNQPLLVQPEPAHGGAVQPGRGLLTCSPAGVVISAVKPAEDQPETGRDLIVRLYESHGRPATATLTCDVSLASVEEADLVEAPLAPLAIAAGQVQVSFRPYEIKTLRLHLR